MNEDEKLRVAFLVPGFPATSETFIINQVADLLDRGVEVDIFAFTYVPVSTQVSDRYHRRQLGQRTCYIQPPGNQLQRLWSAARCLRRIWLADPRVGRRVANPFRYGRLGLSLRLIHWVDALIGRKYSVVHCHFGQTAASYLAIRDALQDRTPFVVTFYGRDASVEFKRMAPAVRHALIHEPRFIFVMSEDMKRRLVGDGMLADRVHVLPVSIDVASYPYRERRRAPGTPVEFVFVGRLVEKKGVDDLLEALARLQQRQAGPFRCTIVGHGERHTEATLRTRVAAAGLAEVVDFRGAMKIEDVIQLLLEKHVLVQPSKTAHDGEME